jgi:hypothetical protein
MITGVPVEEEASQILLSTDSLDSGEADGYHKEEYASIPLAQRDQESIIITVLSLITLESTIVISRPSIQL